MTNPLSTFTRHTLEAVRFVIGFVGYVTVSTIIVAWPLLFSLYGTQANQAQMVLALAGNFVYLLALYGAVRTYDEHYGDVDVLIKSYMRFWVGSRGGLGTDD